MDSYEDWTPVQSRTPPGCCTPVTMAPPAAASCLLGLGDSQPLELLQSPIAAARLPLYPAGCTLIRASQQPPVRCQLPHASEQPPRPSSTAAFLSSETACTLLAAQTLPRAVKGTNPAQGPGRRQQALHQSRQQRERRGTGSPALRTTCPGPSERSEGRSGRPARS